MSSEKALTEFAVWTVDVRDVQLPARLLDDVADRARAERHEAARARARRRRPRRSPPRRHGARRPAPARSDDADVADRSQPLAHERREVGAAADHRTAVDDDRDGGRGPVAASAPATSSGSASSASGPMTIRLEADVVERRVAAVEADRRTDGVEVGRIEMPSLAHDGTQPARRAGRALGGSGRERRVSRAVRRPAVVVPAAGSPDRARAASGSSRSVASDGGVEVREPADPGRGDQRRAERGRLRLGESLDAPARHVGLDPQPGPVARPRRRRRGSCRRRARARRGARRRRGRRSEQPSRTARARCRRSWPTDSPVNAPSTSAFQRGVMAPPRAGEEADAIGAGRGLGREPADLRLGARRGCPRRASGRCRPTRSPGCSTSQRPAGTWACVSTSASGSRIGVGGRGCDRLGGARRCRRSGPARGCRPRRRPRARRPSRRRPGRPAGPTPARPRRRSGPRDVGRRPELAEAGRIEANASSSSSDQASRSTSSSSRHEALRRIDDAPAGEAGDDPARPAAGSRPARASRWSRSQAIFGAPCDGSAFAPDSARIRSASRRVGRRRPARRTARRSIQIGAGASGRFAASTATIPSSCAAIPIAAQSAAGQAGVGGSRRRSRLATATSQVAGILLRPAGPPDG